MLFNAFPDFNVSIDQVIGKGEWVAARLSISGTNTGLYRGLPEPTHRSANWEAIGFVRLADGKIAEIYGTADRMGMLTQLGILPDIG
jgi:predicted ester cyclase